MAVIHPRLQQDCIPVGRFDLCHLLLMNDANYPWFILVPDRDDLTEVFELDVADRNTLMAESCVLASHLKTALRADKINIAALGNMVPQLHIHIVARFQGDPAWPDPIWGKLPAVPYSEDNLRKLLDRLQVTALGNFTETADFQFR